MRTAVKLESRASEGKPMKHQKMKDHRPNEDAEADEKWREAIGEGE
jgi:hypothetical protein